MTVYLLSIRSHDDNLLFICRHDIASGHCEQVSPPSLRARYKLLSLRARSARQSRWMATASLAFRPRHDDGALVIVFARHDYFLLMEW